MPRWFIDTPSDTETVVNSNGVPPAIATPIFAASACGRNDSEHGVFSPCVLIDADEGLGDRFVVEPHGPQEGPVRRAIGAVDGDARAQRHAPRMRPGRDPPRRVPCSSRGAIAVPVATAGVLFRAAHLAVLRERRCDWRPSTFPVE